MNSNFHKSYIYQYYREIKENKSIAGKWIRLVYEILVRGVEDGTYFYSRKKGKRAITFIENYCHHSKGRSDLLKLELWQKAIIESIFALLNENGTRQFREVVIIVSRKNGKSLFASAIIAYMAFLDGEYGAEIYCLAPKLDQANIVFDSFYQSISKEIELAEMCKKRRSDIYINEMNTTIKPLAFSEKKSDGLNPHLIVCDEIASWRGMPGLKMYEVGKSALGARTQPMMLSISTAGYENDSIYDELINRSTKFLNGGSRETQLLPFLYMIDDVEKWDSIEELKKSNPNMGVSVKKEYLQEEIRIAQGSASKKAEFIVKYCNIKQNSSQAWLKFEHVDAIYDENIKLEDFQRCYAVGGIDLSRTTDLTAASIIIEKNGIEYVFTQFFMPRNKVEELQRTDKVPYEIYHELGYVTYSGENVVNYQDVEDWFIMLRKKYKIQVLRIGYDRYSAHYLIDSMEKKGFKMDDVVQGWNLAPMMREYEGKILDRTTKHGNKLLTLHLLNVAVKRESDNVRFKPAKITATDHIDGFVSVIDALTVKSKYYQEIKFLIKNERR